MTQRDQRIRHRTQDYLCECAAVLRSELDVYGSEFTYYEQQRLSKVAHDLERIASGMHAVDNREASVRQSNFRPRVFAKCAG